MTNDVSTLWTFPSRSQEFETGPELILLGLDLRLRYEMGDTSDEDWREIAFQRVFALRFTSYDSMINKGRDGPDAYDRVVEHHGSEWLREMYPAEPWEGLKVRHYRIFFDEIGEYEILAEGFDPEPGGPIEPPEVDPAQKPN